MIRINENYRKLKSSYLFVEIQRRIDEYLAKNPKGELIKLGIGDVTLPLTPTVLKAFHQGVDEMGTADGFHGYGPEQGYEFLRRAIADRDYRPRGVDISPQEIFVSDGSKCDTGNFQELFDTDVTVAVPDPVYPVYVDTNVMAGRTGGSTESGYEGLHYLTGTMNNGFVPEPPEQQVDLIYLCFPNNPTGAVASHEQLARWVEYARERQALILFDAAYYAFMRDDSLPQSIFEIPGAREVAVEFRSLSKTAGFTGTRCAFTVIPEECRAFDAEGNAHKVRELWNRRHSTKFNGVSYPVQRAAAAVYTDDGQREVRELTDYYLENARIVTDALADMGMRYAGGLHSPYVWVEASAASSWDLFEKLLNEAAVVTTPGSGFGAGGEGFIRISAFNSRENVREAVRRIRRAL
jgi:LL-diaminopimelate aminotransferase